jgi:hypothetical protein
MTYAKRLAELALVSFLGAALPVLVANGLGKAALVGALSAGLAAVYGVIVKPVGDSEKPSLVK